MQQFLFSNVLRVWPKVCDENCKCRQTFGPWLTGFPVATFIKHKRLKTLDMTFKKACNMHKIYYSPEVLLKFAMHCCQTFGQAPATLLRTRLWSRQRTRCNRKNYALLAFKCFWNIWCIAITPVYKEAIPVSEKHQADFKFFGHFLPRLSDNDHSQV